MAGEINDLLGLAMRLHVDCCRWVGLLFVRRIVLLNGLPVIAWRRLPSLSFEPSKALISLQEVFGLFSTRANIEAPMLTYRLLLAFKKRALR